MSILKIHAREIFDSRGNPTVEVDLYTKKGNLYFYVLSIFSVRQYVAPPLLFLWSFPEFSDDYINGLKVWLTWKTSKPLKAWSAALYRALDFNSIQTLHWPL